MASMGMMHEGYFVGRKELTAWINQHFDPNFRKVEDCASGAVYCQILNSIYPGSIPMAKVKMNAKTEVDFIHNFKLLQAGFNKKKIDRYIEVDKLTKRSFQFNMEFLQFMKCYWDMHSPAGGGGGAPADALDQKENVASTGIGAPPAREPVAKAPAASRARAAPAASHAGGAAAGGEARAAKAAAAQAADDAKAVEVTELKLHVENLERERDFYYAKLREVEVLCQQKESEQVPFLQDVLAILYRMDDDAEFVAPDGDAPQPVEQAQVA